MIKKILVLCLGNICRSPIAEVMFQDLSKKQGLNLVIDSAGLTAMVGSAASPHSVTVMAERGIALDQHVAKQVTEALVKQADLIFVMDDEQKKMLEQQFHQACGKTFRLGHHSDFDIEDPYQKEQADFEESARKIEKGIHEWLAFLA
ncbi:MAG: low molecular weight phosphotyrosine protein phosphatase [Gammaproteobacteria bacterium]|nr:low molecular weight phosphotyrosine protein phosphatase [Gammaproteobacteria bacterium]